MRLILTNAEISDRFRALASRKGEAIWDRQIVLEGKSYSRPLMWTTWLSNEYRKGPLHSLDPQQWIADVEDESEWRFYSREGEEYSEGGIQRFIPPIRVAIRSPHEYVRILQLPKDQWWQAEFVCPFCNHLNVAQEKCDHLLIAHHWVMEPFRNRRIVVQFQDMWDRRFNCNLANSDLDGVRIKIPRCSCECEWFRFAYWYVIDTHAVENVEHLMECEKQRQAITGRFGFEAAAPPTTAGRRA